MAKLSFHRSSELTLGAELELQLINPETQDLVAGAKDLIRNIRTSDYSHLIKPEITQSMIELNSSIHTMPQSLHEELTKLAYFLMEVGDQLDINFCGGGTHPFGKWSIHKIFPTRRFKNIYHQHRYLAKRFTVFALHIHIGCKNANDAIYLTQQLYRFVPHFIALSASSPFYQGVDTGYYSSRLNSVNAFPLSGTMPFFLNWNEFSEYFLKMRKLNIIHSMKDFYWDIRPKPTFGTIEIRVCDMPLTLTRAISIIAYAQALARYILLEKPLPYTHDLNLVYNYNRFQAARFGFQGHFIDPHSLENFTIAQDILHTLKLIKPHVQALHVENYIQKIQTEVMHKQNDATWLRNHYTKTNDLQKIVQQQCQLWLEQFYKKKPFI